MSNEMISAIEKALLAMKRIYQAGYDRIIECGGACDSPEYMMEGDPTARELRALLAQPAEQHQGEPVHMVRTHGSCCWEEITGESLEMCKADPGEYEVRMLYSRPAEQPASAAVVLPEREAHRDHGLTALDREADGWNACLDEVARLNPPQQ